jgi:hypothetical protein
MQRRSEMPYDTIPPPAGLDPQVDGLLLELKDSLEPLRQALKTPAPPAVEEDEGGSPIDLL